MEAIGLGHDMGHTPFGHAGRTRSTRRAGAIRSALSPQRAVAADRALAQPHHEVCDGILTHTGEREPETLEGKIVRLVDRVAYINHDIDDAVRYGLLGEDDLPREEIAILGDTGSKRIDRLVHDIVESSGASTTSGSRRRWGRRCSRCAPSCSSGSISGRRRRPSTRRRTRSIRAIFDHLVERGDDVDEIVDLHRRHDRPLRAHLRRLALSPGERALDLCDEEPTRRPSDRTQAHARARPRLRYVARRPASGGPRACGGSPRSSGSPPTP